jgi:hypothetical protein
MPTFAAHRKTTQRMPNESSAFFSMSSHLLAEVGPRDLSYAEATRIIGEKIGKPELQYVQRNQ